jgi:hypothetical protein
LIITKRGNRQCLICTRRSGRESERRRRAAQSIGA